jgi:hypothetical protein
MKDGEGGRKDGGRRAEGHGERKEGCTKTRKRQDTTRVTPKN